MLPKFEGRPVVRSAVKITRAGDGLSEALALEPTALHHSDEVFFVLRGSVTQVNHRPTSREEDTLVRVHTVEAQEIAMVDQAAVDKLLVEERERVARLRDEEAGREALPFEEPQGSDTSNAGTKGAPGEGAAGAAGTAVPAAPPIEDYETATVEDIIAAVAVFDAEQTWMLIEWEEAHEDRKDVLSACFTHLDELGSP